MTGRAKLVEFIEIIMNTGEKDSYFVAVKVFLEKDGRLLILKDNFGDWDLPGERKQRPEIPPPGYSPSVTAGLWTAGKLPCLPGTRR